MKKAILRQIQNARIERGSIEGRLTEWRTIEHLAQNDIAVASFKAETQRVKDQEGSLDEKSLLEAATSAQTARKLWHVFGGNLWQRTKIQHRFRSVQNPGETLAIAVGNSAQGGDQTKGKADKLHFDPCLFINGVLEERVAVCYIKHWCDGHGL